MTAPLRRNACPSLAAPMPTGDGLLARLATVSGAVPPAALAAIAAAAARHGNGLIEITRRGSLQIRGLSAVSSVDLAHAIEALGLDLRAGVPVETGPLAGLDPAECADPRPLAARLRAMLATAGLAPRLGPKVSVVIDGGGQVPMHELLADVRLTAAEDGAAWRVAAGGTAETARPVAVGDAAAATRLAFELLAAVAARGRSARARDLSASEISQACARAQLPDVQSAIASSAGARSTPGGGAGIGSAGAAAPIGRFPLKLGRVAVGVGLPFGQAPADRLISLAQASEHAGISEFRLSPRRVLLAVCDDAAAADAFFRAATGLGFVADPSDPRLAVIACAGAPACASAHLAARRIAAEMAASAELAAAAGTLHVSGCEKRCAEPERPRFTVVGTPGGARILEGRDGTELACVAEEEVAVALRRVLGAAGMGGGASVSPRANGTGR